jgi:hypothetical protein
LIFIFSLLHLIKDYNENCKSLVCMLNLKSKTKIIRKGLSNENLCDAYKTLP